MQGQSTSSGQKQWKLLEGNIDFHFRTIYTWKWHHVCASDTLGVKTWKYFSRVTMQWQRIYLAINYAPLNPWIMQINHGSVGKIKFLLAKLICSMQMHFYLWTVIWVFEKYLVDALLSVPKNIIYFGFAQQAKFLDCCQTKTLLFKPHYFEPVWSLKKAFQREYWFQIYFSDIPDRSFFFTWSVSFRQLPWWLGVIS